MVLYYTIKNDAKGSFMIMAAKAAIDIGMSMPEYMDINNDAKETMRIINEIMTKYGAVKESATKYYLNGATPANIVVAAGLKNISLKLNSTVMDQALSSAKTNAPKHNPKLPAIYYNFEKTSYGSYNIVFELKKYKDANKNTAEIVYSQSCPDYDPQEGCSREFAPIARKLENLGDYYVEDDDFIWMEADNVSTVVQSMTKAGYQMIKNDKIDTSVCY